MAETINSPLVYIIIVGFDNYNDTVTCIRSILSNDYPNYKIIVVENGNIEAHKVEITKALKKGPGFNFIDYDSNYSNSKEVLQWLIPDKNRGYAAAANIGITTALQDNKCSYCWILNNDVIIDKSALTALVDFAQKNFDACIIGSKVLYAINPEIINAVGGRFNIYTGWSYNIGIRQKDVGQYDRNNFHFDYIYGASMFASRKMIEDVGVMQEDYFLYYEELDWCIRAKEKGYKNLFCAESKVYHKQGAATGKKSKQQYADLRIAAWQYQNLIKFYWRFYPWLIPVPFIKLKLLALKRISQARFKEAFLIYRIMFGKRIHP